MKYYVKYLDETFEEAKLAHNEPYDTVEQAVEDVNYEGNQDYFEVYDTRGRLQGKFGGLSKGFNQ